MKDRAKVKMKLLLVALQLVGMKIQNESISVIVDLAMTHRSVRDAVEQHKMKKQELKTGICYQISQTKRLSFAVIASNFCHQKFSHSDLFTELLF